MGSVWQRREGGREGEEARRGEREKRKWSFVCGALWGFILPRCQATEHRSGGEEFAFSKLLRLSPSPRLTCCWSRTCSRTRVISFCLHSLTDWTWRRNKQSDTENVNTQTQRETTPKKSMELGERRSDRQPSQQDSCLAPVGTLDAVCI